MLCIWQSFVNKCKAASRQDREENTVIEVIQKGYTIHGRILRPAKVVVSKKPNIAKKEK